MSSTRLGGAIADGLARAGIAHVVVCPGSRSTAVALAMAGLAGEGRIRLHTRTDERAGGFLALGLARAAGAAAIVVTSGTAVGNLMPAVMEARASGVPLVVITADRPATLVGTGANQTTHQTGIFGRHVVDGLTLASTDDAPKAWAAQLARVLASGLGLRTREPGPVHINAAFTEPFIAEPFIADAVAGRDTVAGRDALTGKDASDGRDAADGQAIEDERAARRPVAIARSRPSEAVRLPAGPRTVILAGDAPAQVGQRARAVAESARVPLLAEPSSNARAGGCAIARYRLLLDSALGERIERVVVYGHPTLSRPVSRLMARDDIELIVVSDRASWPDPGWSATQVCDDVQLSADESGWLDEWLLADRQPDESAPWGEMPAASSAAVLSGQTVADAVLASCPQNLVFGASNLIRNADLSAIADSPAAAAQSAERPRTICWANRGLAGIDGVISTASGIALGTGRPTTVLIGDLGFLHDAGSLHLPVGQPVPDLRIVVADDNGGSIFSTLEVAGSPGYEQLFAMPHGRDLAGIAAGYGWPTHRISNLGQLVDHLGRPVRGIEILVAVLGA